MPDPINPTGASVAEVATSLSLCACVWTGRRDAFEAIIGPGATVVKWSQESGSWPPSYCIYRLPSGEIGISIDGTTNGRQWVGHVQGTFASYFDGLGTAGNGPWYLVADGILADIEDAVTDESPRFRIAGHSYGAAVGTFLALFLTKKYGPDAVRLNVFGCPRLLYSGLKAALPAVFRRVESTPDIVTTIPFARWDYFAYDTLNTYVIDVGSAGWTHYGEQWPLHWDGSIGGDPDPPPDELPPGVSTSIVNAHLYYNYAARLKASVARYAAGPAAADAVAAAESALAGENLKTPTESMPPTVTMPNGAKIVVPTAQPDPSTPPFLGGTLTMAAPTLPAPRSGIIKLTFMFNAGRHGWSESINLAFTNANLPHDLAYKWSTKYALERRKILSSKYTMEGARASIIGLDNDATVWATGTNNLGPGLVSGTSTYREHGWLVRLENLESSKHATMIYRGLPDSLVPLTRPDGSEPDSIPDAIGFFAKFLDGFLGNDYTGPATSPGTMRAVILSTETDVTVAVPRPMLELRVGASGKVEIDVEGPITGLNPGAKIKIKHKRKKCLTGLAGTTTAEKVVYTSGKVTITTAKKLCCHASALDGVVGTIQIREMKAFPIYWATPLRVADRDMGRAFFTQRGRQKGGRC